MGQQGKRQGQTDRQTHPSGADRPKQYSVPEALALARSVRARRRLRSQGYTRKPAANTTTKRKPLRGNKGRAGGTMNSHKAKRKGAAKKIFHRPESRDCKGGGATREGGGVAPPSRQNGIVCPLPKAENLTNSEAGNLPCRKVLTRPTLGNQAPVSNNPARIIQNDENYLFFLEV